MRVKSFQRPLASGIARAWQERLADRALPRFGSEPNFLRGEVIETKSNFERPPEPLDLDFQRLYTLTQCLAFFIIRSRKDCAFHRIASHRVDAACGVRCDQTIRLKSFPELLRTQLKCYSGRDSFSGGRCYNGIY